MRRNQHTVARAGRPTEYSLARTLLVALGAALAVVVGALVVMYPALSTMVIAASAVSWALSAAVLRLSLRRRPVRRFAMIRIPYTDLHLEI